MHVIPVPTVASRRQIICGFAATAAAVVTMPAEAAIAPAKLSIHNAHTQETLDVTFRTGKGYDRQALAALDHILRDWRRNEVLHIDPRLFDIMARIAALVGQPPRYEVVSGYRSPETNAMLRRNGRGAAARSLHMVGQAIDLRLAGVKLSALRRTALGLAAGGVGYYPRSNFVHLDTGDVRSWNG